MFELQRRNRDFAILFFVMLMTGAGNTALQSVLPAIGRTLGVADSLIAAVFSVSALIWVFSAPFWARRSDRHGRRRMVLVGTAGFTISILLVGVILFIGLKGLVGPLVAVLAVILSRMIFGIFGSAAPPAAQAMVVLTTPREQRTKALSLLSSAFGLGTLLGLSLAPWMVVPVLGLAGPAIMFTLIGGVCWALVALFLSDDSSSDETPARGANISYPSIGGAPAGASVTAATADLVEEKLKLTDSRIWPWMVTGLIMGHAQAMTGAAMGFLVIDRLHMPVSAIVTQQAIGLVLMCGAGAALLVQWGFIPALNMKPRTMILTGLVIAAAGMILNAFSTSLYGLATSYALASAGFGFTRPGFTAGSSLAVSRRLQGLVAGQVTAVNGSSFVLAPSIGMALYGFWDGLPFLVAAVLLLIMLAYTLLRISPSDPDPSPSQAQ